MTKALIVYPDFPEVIVWNFSDVYKLFGVKQFAPPLGSLTLAALLPNEWDIRFVDMSVQPLTPSDVSWADFVFVGGILVQQPMILKVMDLAHDHKKKVIVGGIDPTSQPDIYQAADYLVLGEAELGIKQLINDLESSTKSGFYDFRNSLPDITLSPVPRFDLIKFKNYLVACIQVARGCPFNCEFCDIIVRNGRKPRVKTPDQVIAELTAIYASGHRGHVDIGDDNFFGNKKQSKQIVIAIRDWSKDHRYPFFYSAQAAINISKDDEMLELMKEIDVRYLHIGLETADATVIESLGKLKQMKEETRESLNKLYRHGLKVHTSFVIGFDEESEKSAGMIYDMVEECCIGVPLVNMMYALPNTRLTGRLKNEGRFFEDSTVIERNSNNAEFYHKISGLNYTTTRPRRQILEDYIYLMNSCFSTKNYFNRIQKLCTLIKSSEKHKPTFSVAMVDLLVFFKVLLRLGFKRETGYFFWRNFFTGLIKPGVCMMNVIEFMTMYIYLGTFRKNIIKLLNGEIAYIDRDPRLSRIYKI